MKFDFLFYKRFKELDRRIDGLAKSNKELHDAMGITDTKLDLIVDKVTRIKEKVDDKLN